jgi:hypothetical protein
LNAGGAYLVNDLYKRYMKPEATDRHYVVAGYVAQVLILALGVFFGYLASSVNQVTQWIVNYLWGGYTAANVLKWHWHRFNGFGYFWGMLAGLGAVMVVPSFVPGSGLGSLGGFAIIFVVSLLGGVIGSLLTDPEEDAILISFYKSVRPWGFWEPVHQKVVAEDPSFERNRNCLRDMGNCVIGLAWQVPLWTIPIYFVFRDWRALWISVFVLLGTSYILKKTWLDKLEDDAPPAEPASA